MADLNSVSKTSCQLLYDGECPICSTFASLANAAETGQLKKIDAREDSVLRQQATAAGMNLDYGIVVAEGGELHYGADALVRLANRKPRTLMASLLYLPFRSRWLAHAFYPVLVRVRWTLLWLTRKDFIRNLPHRAS